MASSVRRTEAAQIASLMLAAVREVMPLDDSHFATLPVGQLRVCGSLCGGPQPMSVLSAEMGVSQSAMTQIADRLERAGLVRRVADDSDRRVKRLMLTARGARIMQQREKARVARMAVVLGHMAPTARKRVASALALLADACAAAQVVRCSQAPRKKNASSSRKRLS